MDLSEALKRAGVDIEPVFNGKIIRNGSQWFAGQIYEKDGHKYEFATFGDFKSDTEEKWNSGLNGSANTDEIKRSLQELQAVAAKEKEQEHERVAEKCQADFAADGGDGQSGYLLRKQITNLFGARLRANPNGGPILIVPLRDVDGKLWNLQRVYDKRFPSGDKFFEPGGRIDGCFHILETDEWSNRGPGASPNEVYICEGFATAASCALAFGNATVPGNNQSTQQQSGSGAPNKSRMFVAAFNAGNLKLVAQSLRGAFPKARFVICADNDAYTVINGEPVNVGLLKARQAAGACQGEMVYPVFTHPQKGFTDWNDLHCAEGLEKVRDQIENPDKYAKGLQPMIKPEGRKLNEAAIVQHILKFYSGNIIKCGDVLFKYEENHWSEFEERDYDLLKRQIHEAGGKLPSKDVMAVYKAFMFTVEHVPPNINLHMPNPYLANFQNGTLHLDPDKPLSLKPHEKRDWATSVLPHDCPDFSKPAPETPMFDAWCERLWPAGEPRGEIKQLIFELMGACLLPAYPNITFFIGASNSGKSTLVKLMVNLVSLPNTSQVQLCDMKNHMLEPMLGKLVNFDTELDLNRPINDVVVKKIVDRMPFIVNRKYKKPVQGYLPAVHFFAANDLPPTLDGQSKAYGRRIIGVRLDAPLGQGEVTLEYDRAIWKAEGPGLVVKAIQALERLRLRGGVFTRPTGSAKMIDSMEKRSDLVEQFLELASEFEIQDPDGFLKVDKNDKTLHIKRWELWLKFQAWQRCCGVGPNLLIGQKTFFQRMGPKFDVVQVEQGSRSYQGIGWVRNVVV